MLSWDFRLLNTLLLLSTRSRSILSLKLTFCYIFISASCFSATTYIVISAPKKLRKNLYQLFLIIILLLSVKYLIVVHSSIILHLLQIVIVKHSKNNSCVYININIFKQNKLNKDPRKINMRAYNWNLSKVVSLYMSYSFKRNKQKRYKET